MGHWLDFFEVNLPAKGPDRLIEYLESRIVWRQDGDRPVFKTVDEPCIAYTAQVIPGTCVALVALGACYRYPNGGEEVWWQEVIGTEYGT